MNGEEIKFDPLNIISFVIDLIWSTGPVPKYSKDKTNIDTNNKVNKENFCRVPLFKNAERIEIIKSSLPVSFDILFNTQIIQSKISLLDLKLFLFQLRHMIMDHRQY